MKRNKYTLVLLIGLVSVFFAFQNPFFEIAKQIEIYNTLFKELNMNYIDKINPGNITDRAIKNTLSNLDPYTNFYNEQDVEDARIRRAGEYGGIGIATYYNYYGISIADIYEGYAADKAGLKAGDLVVNVNGQELKGLERNVLSTMLKGVPGKEVKLKINRNGKLLNFTLALDKIEVNPVPFSEMINQETGYIVLTRFNNKASSEVKKAFLSLKEKGMKKLVLDLRSNPGGSLGESINIVNFFIPKGKKVVETRGKTKKNSRIYKGNKTPLDTEIPIVVLINGRSASASEIVSGALQDYDRAVILGERSFGKGLVQRYFKLNYGTQLKATISKYYTPSGRCIQELDYANRDPKTGKVPKFSDGMVNKFLTQNGREVYDGGGVTPDVKIEISKRTEATKKLLRTRAIFGFAAHYIHQNNSINLDDFSFSKSNFGDFKNYLLTKDTTFVTNEEKLFKDAYKSVKIKDNINSDYQSLKQKLAQEKVAEISKNKDILLTEIENEILEQKFYKSGVYKHKLKFDTTLKKAIKVLDHPTEYNSILGN